MVPARRVTYSRVQNESEHVGGVGGGGEAARSVVFCTAQTSLALLGPLTAPAPHRLTPDCYRDSAMYYYSSRENTYSSQTHIPRRLNSVV